MRGVRTPSAAAAVIVETLAPVETLRVRHDEIVKGGPIAGSPAAVEATHPLGQYATRIASFRWAAASENALAWYRLVADARVMTMAAHCTLARAALEGAAVCRWLVERELTVEERRWRGTVAQLEDYRQRRSFERSIGLDESRWIAPGKPARVRQADLEREVKRHGVADRRMPGMTDLFRTYVRPEQGVDGEWVYRILSGFAHGYEWAIWLSDRGEPQAIPGLSGTFAVRTTGSDRWAVTAATVTMQTPTAALDELAAHEGRM